jgi:hypothetical protein
LALGLLTLALRPAAGMSAQPSAAHDDPRDPLLQGFEHTPAEAKLRCYWWWLNGNTDQATITHDLEEMARMGYGGAILVDANGSNQNGNQNVPAGPEFGSPAWTLLYVHALKEAQRLGLEITLNITSGWNLGGPEVKPRDASKLLTWSRATVASGQIFLRLGRPPVKNGFYERIAVLAYPLKRGTEIAGSSASHRESLRGLTVRSAAEETGFSMPNTDWMLSPAATTQSDEDTLVAQIQNISADVDTAGNVHWQPPAGDAHVWEILELGYTDSDARVSTSSGAWQGLAIDYLDPRAFDLYWNATVEPLLQSAKPYVGHSLKYVATDSWELGGTNWTESFREEFVQRRGYDPLPYLPVVAGRIVGSRAVSTSFLNDLRRTVGDLVNSHYDRMAERARAYGLGIQCESGGPHGAPIDALETFRSSAIPQTEYWAMSKEHRSSDSERFFVKEGASAAHIYGRPLAAAEGMTSIGNQWSESIGMNLRPSFDQALTEGMNRLVWHEFTSSPAKLGLPGQEYFAGTHLNPNVTWWHEAGPFLQYLNRSQFLLQQGQPVSDVLYYYGDNVPNFVRLKSDDPAKVLPGFDYDVIDTEALLHRISIANGRLETPEGIGYRALALPASRTLPLAVLRWIKRFVEDGATVIGLRPLQDQSLISAPDQLAFNSLADDLWKACEADPRKEAAVGNGHVYCTSTAHEALLKMRVRPDFEDTGQPASQIAPRLDYVHRVTAVADIYFIRNTLDKPVATTVLLRVSNAQPQLFHADIGTVDTTLLFSATADGRTSLPLSFKPYDSVFVVLRHAAPARSVLRIARNGTTIFDAKGASIEAVSPLPAIVEQGGEPTLLTSVPGDYSVAFSDGGFATGRLDRSAKLDVPGPWTLHFPAGWGAPAQIHVPRLQSWTLFDEAGVRYFSGTAVYRTTLQLSPSQLAALSCANLNLGELHEVASVEVNGEPAGTLWKSPYIAAVGRMLHEGSNDIEVSVTNLWPNRIIGDAQSPFGQHYTWTNIRAYGKNSPLLPSGLVGPVILESACPVKLQRNPR